MFTLPLGPSSTSITAVEIIVQFHVHLICTTINYYMHWDLAPTCACWPHACLCSASRTTAACWFSTCGIHPLSWFFTTLFLVGHKVSAPRLTHCTTSRIFSCFSPGTYGIQMNPWNKKDRPFVAITIIRTYHCLLAFLKIHGFILL